MPKSYRASDTLNWLPPVPAGVALLNSATTSATATSGFGLQTGQLATVTITAVDPEADPLTYTFPVMTAGASTGPRKPATSTAVLAGSGATRTFTPDVAGTYCVQA